MFVEVVGGLALLLAVMVTLGLGFAFIIWIVQQVLND